MPSEIVASFELTPELWFRASRCVLRRQHRLLSPRAVWTVVPVALLALAVLDFSGILAVDLLPAFILLNVIVPLGCLGLVLTPFLIRRRFDRLYQRLPPQNRRAVWRFSPFNVSAEGGLTRFDGGWDELREIVATPEFFLIFRKEKSAAAIPVDAFASPESREDFVYLARSQVSSYLDES